MNSTPEDQNNDQSKVAVPEGNNDKIKNENSGWKTVRKFFSELEHRKSLVDIIYAFIQIGLIVLTLIFAYNSYQQTNYIFKHQNRPNLIISPMSTETIYNLSLWNMGPGVAYDIQVEIHLADNIGNIRSDNIRDCVRAMMDLETKSEEQLYINRNESTIGTDNPPSVMPVGIEYGFRSSNLILRNPLSEMFIILRYKDNLGDPYYSLWDGNNWKHSSGEPGKVLPVYERHKRSTPAHQFFSMLLTSPDNGYIESILLRRIYQEAFFLKENGYGDIPKMIEEEIERYNEVQSRKLIQE